MGPPGASVTYNISFLGTPRLRASIRIALILYTQIGVTAQPSGNTCGGAPMGSGLRKRRQYRYFLTLRNRRQIMNPRQMVRASYATVS